MDQNNDFQTLARVSTDLWFLREGNKWGKPTVMELFSDCWTKGGTQTEPRGLTGWGGRHWIWGEFSWIKCQRGRDCMEKELHANRWVFGWAPVCARSGWNSTGQAKNSYPVNNYWEAINQKILRAHVGLRIIQVLNSRVETLTDGVFQRWLSSSNLTYTSTLWPCHSHIKTQKWISFSFNLVRVMTTPNWIVVMLCWF